MLQSRILEKIYQLSIFHGEFRALKLKSKNSAHSFKKKKGIISFMVNGGGLLSNGCSLDDLASTCNVFSSSSSSILFLYI